jgi:phenylacetate-CoA ligase
MSDARAGCKPNAAHLATMAAYRGARRSGQAVRGLFRSRPRLAAPETWSVDALATEQRRLLGVTLRDAARRIPFWRDRLRGAGVIRGDGSVDLQRFSAIPLLERADVALRSDELADMDFPGETWWDQTGGSTGEPVRVLKDRASKDAKLRAKAQMHAWAGHRAGAPLVSVWGAERDILEDRFRPPFWAWPFGSRIRCRQLVQNAFRMGESEMAEYLGEWDWFRPHTVLGYAHSLHDLALFAERTGTEPYSPVAVITSAGALTAEMKADIRRIFRAPVFDRYGSREFGNMAMSCERDRGLHTIPTTEFIEILSEDGTSALEGEVGEIIVTSLTARAMPMIRYRIGDMGRRGEACPCDRPFPVIAQVIGRVTDSFVGVNRCRVHGEYFTHLLWAVPAIRRFQVIQERIDSVTFRLVLDQQARFDQGAEEARLTEHARKALGASCRVSFEYPADIEVTSTGKHRFTISHVSSSAGW